MVLRGAVSDRCARFAPTLPPLRGRVAALRRGVGGTTCDGSVGATPPDHPSGGAPHPSPPPQRGEGAGGCAAGSGALLRGVRGRTPHDGGRTAGARVPQEERTMVTERTHAVAVYAD